MTNRSPSALLLSLLLILASRVVAEPEILGSAYLLEAPDTLVYRETYEVLDEQTTQVTYLSPEDEVIAEKRLDYSTGEATPSFRLTDLRFEQVKSVSVSQGRLQFFVDEEGKKRKKERDRAKAQVVDAGFTHFLRQNWSGLINGEDVDFDFAFVDRLDNVSLTASKVDQSDTPFGNQLAASHYFSMALDNALLALLVDPIYLAFDDQQRLLAYAGRSNLKGPKGKPVDVIIRYVYTGARSL